MQRYVPIRVDSLPDDAARARALRLNSLGSMFYFIKVALRRNKLTQSLHMPFCQTLEREHIKDVIEMPRDHFKSTICGEGLPMWRALPLSQQDIDEFYQAGYTDEFIRWMRRVHNPDVRNLLVSENITNAAKLGRKIRWHYESNPIYRSLFPETLPDTSCVWTDYSLHVKRPKSTTGGAHGEGTFDFLGVGSAAQSRHYNGMLVQDDLVGRKAIESPSIMEKTIEYHQLAVGLMVSDDSVNENDELVVGNRWGYYDLNSHLREHEKDFRFESHSALGGCCDRHPAGVPIFPEMFSVEKLLARKSRLGAFQFSCQFLNDPSSPEDADFKTSWLNYYDFTIEPDGSNKIRHVVNNGIVRRDLDQRMLNIVMVVDPNHSGAQGRARHAIVVLGLSEAGDYYLLDTWAKAAGFDEFYDMIFKLAIKWKLHRIGVETIAAQKYIAHHIKYLCRDKNYSLRIDELKGEVEAPDGTLSKKKEFRIRAILSPIAEGQRLYIQATQRDFINEYETFPKGKFVDLLDAFAYAPQLLRVPMNHLQYMDLLAANQRAANLLSTPYSVVN